MSHAKEARSGSGPFLESGVSYKMDLFRRGSAWQRNNIVMRIGCFLVSVSMMVSLVIQPPKAKAVIAEASLATSVIWSFMQSAGITFNSSNMSSSAWAEAMEPYLKDFVEWKDSTMESFWKWLGYDDAAGFIQGLKWTHENTVSKIYVPPAIAKKLAEFTNWFVDKIGVISGGDSKPFYDGASHLSGSNGYEINDDHYFSKTYNYTFGNNSLSIVNKSSSGSYLYTYCRFYTPTFVAPDSGKYTLSFVGSTSENYFDSSPWCKLGFFSVAVYKTKTADSDSFSYWGYLYDDHSYNHGYEIAVPGPCSSSVELNFVKGEKYRFEIKVGAGDEFSSAVYFWDFALNKSGSVASTGTAAVPGAIDVPVDDTGERSTIITIPGLDTEIAGINDLLQQILDKLAANELAATAAAATQPDPEEPDEETPDLEGLGLPALGAALVTRFPFSIPWDVVKGIKLVAAPAEAPRWEVDFLAPIAGRVGGWKGDTKIVIDMGEYPIIGQVCRWTSMIGFCLILASGTKKLIWTA